MTDKLQFSIIFCFLLLCVDLSSQSVDDLEKQKKEVSSRIANANKLLIQYSKQRSINLNSIQVLNVQIGDRKKLILLSRKEIGLLQSEIKILNGRIVSSTNELALLKDQYARLIRDTYKNKCRFNELSFFFGARSFNKAYRRYVMLKDYNSFRHNQGILIDNKSRLLNESSVLLKSKLKIQNNALERVESETRKLEADKGSLKLNLQKLGRKQDDLTKELRRQKKALKKLENAIVKMIQELAETKVEPSDFHLSKGKLPWPVSKGVVISRFGEHGHAVLKHVKVNNNGIDIQSSASNDAKAVFSGVVSRVVSIPGYNKAVLVRHGKFLTVYANLDVVHVNKGQSVTNKTVIGTIYSGDSNNSGVLHFEIWQESVKLNPEIWLLK